MKTTLSIRDISRQAGVSIATVSRVINQNGRYSEETRQRVMRIIEENHYVPNQVAKGLRMHRTKNVGIIVPDITNEFFMKLVSEIEKELFAHGYETFLCNTDEKEELERARVRMMATQNVCGLIYLSGGDVQGEDPEAEELPTVFIDRIPQQSGRHCRMVTSDNVEGGRLATQELLDQGCRNILMLTSADYVSAYAERFEGYMRALAERQMGQDAVHLCTLKRLHYREANDAVREILEQGPFPYDGIFAASDWLALGAYRALSKVGIRVPEDVKIVGFDDISITAFNTVPITTVHQQVDVMGRTAVKQLLKELESPGETASERMTTIPVYLVPRRSTRLSEPSML